MGDKHITRPSGDRGDSNAERAPQVLLIAPAGLFVFHMHPWLIMLHMSVVLHIRVGAGPELVEGSPPASGAFAAIL